MKRYVVARIDLGQTRIAGFLLYSSNSENGFEELTQKETMLLVQADMVNGLKNIDGELVPDVEGFNQQNIKIRSGVGKYRNMVETGKHSNTGYTVIRTTLHDSEDVYQLVTSKCGRFDCDTEKLKMLCNFADVAGVRLNDDGEIELCEGVEVLDFRSMQGIKNCDLDEVVDVGGKLIKVSELDGLTAEELTPEYLFGDGNSETSETENAEPVNTEVIEKTATVKKPASKSPVKKKK